ncbi:MAG TPA: hypothetical protein VKE94_21615 [Gemmataceae bacterium]|nr:hypothetical protein [Gemmataceae bacterium]
MLTDPVANTVLVQESPDIVKLAYGEANPRPLRFLGPNTQRFLSHDICHRLILSAGAASVPGNLHAHDG